ncbi:hypothetical protein [Oceanicoccus sp. KOV_DT_Chl]|uniref:hypothetical protein n=1 Tax=Oceanicoccus sp. KOV_DT_Chl TaxID=1904639 RepID=UPI000C7E4480|nr:hypothetical protein [Oceanicoccus sp. KOV_DT_Chl]
MQNQTRPNPYSITDNTPIIIGSGQYTERIKPQLLPPYNSPMALAAIASQNAINDSGIPSLAEHIDTIAVTRLFSDSTSHWPSPYGRSDNPPQSVAVRIGAQPSERIYSEVGGTQPLQLLIEMSHDIARGEKTLVLLTGAEAIGYEKLHRRKGVIDNWNETFTEPLDDRGFGERMAAPQEIDNGLMLPIFYYSLIENQRAYLQGHDAQQHRSAMAQLLANLSSVAAKNKYAHSRKNHTFDDLILQNRDNYLLSQPYSKKFVSQDNVNQAAAILVTSVGKAKALGIASKHWIFIDGFAQANDHFLSQRPSLAKSAAMEATLKNCLSMANKTIDTIDIVDLYSCFPCAVTAACETLQLPMDASNKATITGGLPFFGGPGNNYSMHAIAEASSHLKRQKSSALITANGGMLSKHAAVILSGYCNNKTLTIDWQHSEATSLPASQFPAKPFCANPESGSVLSHTIKYVRNGMDEVIIIAETINGERFVAHSNDPSTVTAVEIASPIHRQVAVTQTTQNKTYSNHFSFISG